MTYQISIARRHSWVKRFAQYLRAQYRKDAIKSQIRKERRDLANLSDQQLRDIGITRHQAELEASRGYDDVPSSRLYHW